MSGDISGAGIRQVFRDNNESNTQERSAILVNVHPLKHSNCPLDLLLKSDWGNHANTTEVARRIILQYPHETCCSHLIEATMPRQQTWQGVSFGNNNRAVRMINQSVGGSVR
jgi:hypothetical protein